jgi:hypothetical protein
MTHSLILLGANADARTENGSDVSSQIKCGEVPSGASGAPLLHTERRYPRHFGEQGCRQRQLRSYGPHQEHRCQARRCCPDVIDELFKILTSCSPDNERIKQSEFSAKSNAYMYESPAPSCVSHLARLAARRLLVRLVRDDNVPLLTVLVRIQLDAQSAPRRSRGGAHTPCRG